MFLVVVPKHIPLPRLSNVLYLLAPFPTNPNPKVFYKLTTLYYKCFACTTRIQYPIQIYYKCVERAWSNNQLMLYTKGEVMRTEHRQILYFSCI